MKNLFFTIFSYILICNLLSCSSDNIEEEANNNSNVMTLNKRIIFETQSLNPELDTKRIQYFTNNQIVADTTFDYQNIWIKRNIIFFNGTTKVFQTLDTSGLVTNQREEYYDTNGRITGRQTIVPNNNMIAISYIYNSDETITVNSINVVDQSITFISKYYKNSNGLIYKETGTTHFPTTQNYENTLLFDNLKPTSLTSSLSSTILNFGYYNNPKPSNLLKINTQLNNEVLYGLTLSGMAEFGNYYFKKNNATTNDVTVTYETNFNTNNYIEYYKSTYKSNTYDNLLTTEIFYYYN